MPSLSGNVFVYTTNVNDEQIYTILTLLKDDKLECKNANMTENQFYDTIARSVELQYIDGLSVVRTITGNIFLTNCYVTEKGNKFLDDFKF